ncbi:hypothetical protein ACWDR0_15635 [Streptomyces sp. NPDC003691]
MPIDPRTVLVVTTETDGPDYGRTVLHRWLVWSGSQADVADCLTEIQQLAASGGATAVVAARIMTESNTYTAAPRALDRVETTVLYRMYGTAIRYE